MEQPPSGALLAAVAEGKTALEALTPAIKCSARKLHMPHSVHNSLARMTVPNLLGPGSRPTLCSEIFVEQH